MDIRDYGRGGRALAAAVEAAYLDGLDDYAMEPLVPVDERGQSPGRISDGDAVIFCCRRGEREIELTDAFTAEVFAHFERRRLESLHFVTLTLYHEKFKRLPIAFAPARVEDTLAECVSRAGLTQLHLAESEKFAHVTYFFNGGQAYPGETDIRVPSPKGIPFDRVPELSLKEVVAELKKGMREGFGFIVTNFANGDVVGHTASCEAKRACAAHVDSALGEALRAAKERDYIVAVTADHGNLERLFTNAGKPHVSHTASPVPFLVIDPRLDAPITVSAGTLADVAPTCLHILDIEAPAAMTGQSLVPGRDFGGRRKLALIILDGWGIGGADEGNPIHVAHTPVWDGLTSGRFGRLEASGTAVGLQAGKAGNSEAGHTNMGAGRIVMQDDVRLDMAMKDGSFSSNPVFLETMRKVKGRRRALHLIALLTKKSSHGSVDYPLALLRIAKEEGLHEAYVHILFDGRSTEPGSAPALLMELERDMEEIGLGRIVGGVGRGVALDRDGNYGKIRQAYEAMTLGKGRQYKLNL